MKRHARAAPTAGCWPDAVQELLLTAALSPREPAARAWSAWRSQCSLDAADPASFRLLPLIYRNLAGTDALGADEPRLRGVIRQNWVRNQRRLRLAAGAVAALSGAGIPTLGLKGIVLGSHYYGHVAVRSMLDVDLLVPDAAAERAVDALGAEGWRLVHPPFARERRRGCSTPLVNPTGDELDLHWHLLLVQPFASVDEAFWRGSVSIDIGGVATRALQPADELLHIVVHGLHWNPVNSLRWIADAATVIRSSPELDWDRLLASAERYALVHPLRLALAYLAGRFGVAVPEPIAGRLCALPSTLGARVEWWARMRGPAMPPGPFGYVLRYWRQYRRIRRHAGSLPTPAGFGRYVGDSLRVEGLGQLAGAIAGETLERIRWASLTHRRPRGRR